MGKVGIIGFGNMGSALALGLKAREIEVVAVEKRADVAETASKIHGIPVLNGEEELVQAADPIIIAVKPQDAEELSRRIGSSLSAKSLISIMAGRSIAYLREAFKPARLARFMPNLAARHQKALIGVSFEPEADQDFRRLCFTIAEAIGSPLEIPERLMAAFTGLSSSGIAFVFAFLQAMALAGVKQGFPYPQSLRIGIDTAEGALELLKESGENPSEWLSRVISPAGTTIQGVAALEELGFTHSVIQAVERASRRARELEDQRGSG